MRVEPSWMRLVPLQTRSPRAPLSLAMWGYSEKTAICEPESRPSPDTKAARNLILDFQPLKVWEVNILSIVFSFSHPNGLRHKDLQWMSTQTSGTTPSVQIPLLWDPDLHISATPASHKSQQEHHSAWDPLPKPCTKMPPSQKAKTSMVASAYVLSAFKVTVLYCLLSNACRHLPRLFVQLYTLESQASPQLFSCDWSRSPKVFMQLWAEVISELSWVRTTSTQASCRLYAS